MSNYYPIRLPSDGVISSLSTNIFARKFYNSYVINPFLCTNTMFESQIDLEQKREGYITRTERYNHDAVQFDPNVL